MSQFVFLIFNLLIVGEKRWANVRVMWMVLILFEEVSGLRVHFHKILLVGVNVNELTKDQNEH